MLSKIPWLNRAIIAGLILLSACAAPTQSAPLPEKATETNPPMETTAVSKQTSTTPAPDQLSITLFYPSESAPAEMGQPVKFTVQVFNREGKALDDAQVALTILNTAGEKLGEVPLKTERGNVYRSAPWTVPHGSPAGVWQAQITAKAPGAQGEATSGFSVIASMSDTFLSKYGFWLDPPDLYPSGIQLFGEKGDARNGMIRRGGQKANLHIIAMGMIEVHWREGDYNLQDEEAVRRFLLEDLGEIGFTPIRALGPYTRTKFKNWDAWQVECKGEFSFDDIEWMVFYAPEVNKTYAIGTFFDLPPVKDAHAVFRDSFAVHPEVAATGVAPQPLSHLLPGPTLVSPPIAARYQDLEKPVILTWEPVKDLAQDEYYQVKLNFNYKENNPSYIYATRDTQFTVPEELYRIPNCQVFNWRITLMRQTGVDSQGKPVGEPLSYDSLYWYYWWLYPPSGPDYIVTCAYNHKD